MKSAEMRDKAENELKVRERELREQLFKLRFQSSLGSGENPLKIRQVRREIARVQTILNEKTRAAQSGK
ncbi:MAG TPA: 50S ribosomal protein L29 [Thermoanaerobaculia bacterium]|nr:50S ribosomal protein L29 [Thermoanaerobaculia bacterium]